jgi:hypothetical protein
MKKTPISRLSKMKAGSRATVEDWHNGGDIEIVAYARSLQNAARTLVGDLEREQTVRGSWDVWPIVLLYREALEIHLKLLVGEGSNFLSTRTDPISLFNTHSLRWLAQIVCRIIKKVGWENEFTSEGVLSLADFSAFVKEVESFDPVGRAIRSSGTTDIDEAWQYCRGFQLLQFAKKLDALLDLLGATADALAATWDMQEKAMAGGEVDGGDFKTPIQ